MPMMYRYCKLEFLSTTNIRIWTLPMKVIKSRLGRMKYIKSYFHLLHHLIDIADDGLSFHEDSISLVVNTS